MVTLSAHQNAYWPWMGWMNKVGRADVFIVLDNVGYEKNSYINRNKIKGPEGEIWLTVPLKTKGNFNKPIWRVEESAGKWRTKHPKTIRQYYGKAVFFTNYFWAIEKVYSYLEWHRFFPIEMMNTRWYYQSILQIEGHKQELIINLCKHFKADRFIFGAKGRDYCDMGLFKKHGIEPLFQDFMAIEYPQLWGPFIPNLSVIDALFNVGAKRTRELIMEGWKP